MKNIKGFLVLISIFAVFGLFTGHVSATSLNDNDTGLAATQDNPVQSGDNLLNSSIRDLNTNTDYSSIQDAINDSLTHNGDTILLNSGIYNSLGDMNLTINKNISIVGTDPNTTVIDAKGQGIFTIFTIPQGVTVNISNITFTNANSGISGTGGAINNQGKLNITNCIFTNNSANWGGAILNNGGNLTVSNSTFLNNSVTHDGGAIINGSNAILSVDTSNFLDNTAANSSGAIMNWQSTMTVTSSNFSGNTAGWQANAIGNYYNTATVNFNRIVGNKNYELYNGYSGTFNATNNWWGSNANPSAYVYGNVNVTHWLVLNITATPNNNGNSTITANLNHDNLGNLENGPIPDGIPVNFTTTLGSINTSSYTNNGIAQSNLNYDSESGAPIVSATIDNQTAQTTVPTSNITLPTVSANIPSGPYSSSQNIILNMNEPGTIYYTTDGSTPTYNSNRYTSPININKNTILKFFAKDIAGNDSPIYTNYYTITTTIPQVISTNPAKSALNVPIKPVIKITFNEPIQFGSNPWIELKTNNGIAIPFTPTINGNLLTITPKSPMLFGTQYNLILHSNSIKDSNGNSLVAYSSKFTTIPQLIVTSTNPGNDAYNIAIPKTININFNRAIKFGNSWIELKNSKGIAIPFTSKISGSTLIITPKSLLTLMTYTIRLHTNSIIDQTGNGIKLFSTKLTFAKPKTASAYGITFLYPANWSIQTQTQDGTGLIFVSNIRDYNPDASQAIVQVTPNPSGVSDKEIFESIVDASYPSGFNIISKQTSILNGNTAYQVTFTINDKTMYPEVMVDQEINIVKNHKTYTLDCIATIKNYESDKSIFKSMINSFRIK